VEGGGGGSSGGGGGGGTGGGGTGGGGTGGGGTLPVSGPSSFCLPCPGGSYPNSNGTSCLPCSAGSYSSLASRNCTSCEAGKVQPREGKTRCEECMNVEVRGRGGGEEGKGARQRKRRH